MLVQLAPPKPIKAVSLFLLHLLLTPPRTKARQAVSTELPLGLQVGGFDAPTPAVMCVGCSHRHSNPRAIPELIRHSPSN